MTSILISGYYGYGNAGDEALLRAILGDLRRELPDAHVEVLSAVPRATAEAYGVRAVPRFNLAAVGSALRRCRLLLSGGGSLLQDETSVRSVAYYAGLMLLARQVGSRVMVYANGLGPLHSRTARLLARRALEAAHVITLRDPLALQTLHRLGVGPPGSLEVTADPTFGLSPPSAEARAAARRTYGLQNRSLAVFALRPWPANPAFLAPVTATARHLAEVHGLLPVILPMYPRQDDGVARRLAERLDETAHLLQGPVGPEALLAVLAEAKVVVGMRLHSLILAVRCGTPVVGLARDPKVAGFLTICQQPFLDARGLTAERLRAAVVGQLEAHDATRRRLLSVAETLAARARRNGRLAARLARDGVPAVAQRGP